MVELDTHQAKVGMERDRENGTVVEVVCVLVSDDGPGVNQPPEPPKTASP